MDPSAAAAVVTLAGEEVQPDTLAVKLTALSKPDVTTVESVSTSAVAVTVSLVPP